jgi:hypothetical protein
MSRRQVVLGISVVLAIAVAVPAVASNPTASTSAASTRSIAKKALKKAKKALKKANQAITIANQALAQGGAQGPAGVQGPAGPASVASTGALFVNGSADPSAVQPLAVNEGFAWALVCSDGPPADPTTLLVVANLTGGDNSHIAGALFFTDEDGNPIGNQSDDFDDNGEEVAVVAAEAGGNQAQRAGAQAVGAPFTAEGEGSGVLVYGTAAQSTQEGWGGVLNDPVNWGGVDCVGSLNLLSL